MPKCPYCGWRAKRVPSLNHARDGKFILVCQNIGCNAKVEEKPS